MKDPKPLAGEGASDVEQRWLSAARLEEPPPEVVARIERALGLAAGAAGTAAVATAAAKGGLSALRIAGLSALGLGGTVGLVLLLARSASSPPPAASAAAPPPAAVVSPAGERAAAPAAGTGTLRDEIALIDGARAALAAGAPGQALSLLERYRVRHPRGTLLPEALAMRIEAIDGVGEHARARELARAFLAEHPDSPLAQRLAHLAGRE